MEKNTVSRPVVWLLAIALLGLSPAAAQSIADRLRTIVESEAIAAKAFVGVAVLDPQDTSVVFSHNGALLFTPASNTKLFSTALALSRLGPNHRMRTELRAEGNIEPGDGVLRGDLVMAGYGDLSLGARSFPYSRETENVRDYNMPAFQALADSLRKRGIRRVTGDIVGDDSAFVWEAFREGWAQDDALFEYGAPVSALSVNDNSVTISVSPGERVGEPAVIAVAPALPYFDILNRVTTSSSGFPQVRWERINGQQLLLMEGTIPAGAKPWVRTVAMDDPALYAASFLRAALLRNGVEVEGKARARHRYPGEQYPDEANPGDDGDDGPVANRGAAEILAFNESPPLGELLATTNKESVNLYAELLLCEVARVKNGVGSRKGGLTELLSFLREIGVGQEGVALEDASGLARLNLVSPLAAAALLSAMRNGPHAAIWESSLPLGGLEGTLDNRFGGNPLASKIRAKTGTLRGVSALSGYASTRSGKTYAFSAMVNHYSGSSRPAREFLDKIALALADSP